MRLLEKNNTENVYNNLNEEWHLADSSAYKDKDVSKYILYVDTGFSSSDKKAHEILSSVEGQLSDGIWENSRGMEKVWHYSNVETKDGKLVIAADVYNYDSYFRGKDEEFIRKYFANKVKQIVKINIEDGIDDHSGNAGWKRDCECQVDYMGYDEKITIKDCYRVYDKLLGRIDRITEGTLSDMHMELEDVVKRDFQIFIEDKYDIQNVQDLADALEHVTEEDINEYFTSMFYDIYDNDDLDTANVAEQILRKEYGLQDNFNESIEQEDHKAPEDLEELVRRVTSDGKFPDEIEYKGKIYKAFNVMSSETSGANSQVYYCNMENTPSGDPQESNDYFFVSATLNQVENGYRGIKNIEFIEDLTEGIIITEGSAAKSKKKTEEKRVIMQQGNVTCFKENDNCYLVFENESDNEVEYDNQESAMQDFMERIGIDTNAKPNEDLKEATDYWYQEDKDGTNYKLGERYFNSFKEIEDEYIEPNVWNEASKEEREEMVKPVIEKFIEMNGTDLQDTDTYKSFCSVMEDNNWHTELRLITEYINNNYKW